MSKVSSMRLVYAGIVLLFSVALQADCATLFSENDGKGTGSARIIGGSEAEPLRYPYLVVVVSKANDHICGGTLIAPDIVLTAGHCYGSIDAVILGRHDISLRKEDGERRITVTEQIRHPKFNDETVGINYDFMLLKLSELATDFPIARLNRDPNFPSKNGQELTVMGWGDVDLQDGTLGAGTVLSEVTVNFMTQRTCGNIEDGPGTFSEFLQNDQMCALDRGEGVCHGDSGGPLTLLDSDGDRSGDLVLGVVSWGFDCKHDTYPSFFGRVSKIDAWLSNTVCSISWEPPDDFECGFGRPFVTLQITLDLFPEDTRWTLETVSDYGGDIIGGRSYTKDMEGSKFEERVALYPTASGTRSYMLTVYDDDGDGLCCMTGSGSYTLFFGSSLQGRVLGLGSNFDSQSSVAFTLSADGSVALENPGDPVDPPPTVPEPQPYNVFITIIILFDYFPEEIGYTVDYITDDGDFIERIAAVSPGEFEEGKGKVVERVPLYDRSGGYKRYRFTMLDTKGDGLCCDSGKGKYQVWFGPLADKRKVTEGGDFGSSQSTDFAVVGTEATDSPVPAPSIDGVSTGSPVMGQPTRSFPPIRTLPPAFPTAPSVATGHPSATSEAHDVRLSLALFNVVLGCGLLLCIM